MIRRFSQQFQCLILLAFVVPAQAGNLWLNNGDRISGEPDELSGGKLKWISDSVGPISISQLNIRFLESDLEMVLQIGKDKPLDACRFEVDDGKPVTAVAGVKAAAPAAEALTPAATSTKTSKNPKLKPAAATAARRSAEPAAAPASGLAEAPAAQSTAPAPAPPVPQPQQWIMCKDQGFPLSSWKQVSRFFKYKAPTPNKVETTGKVALFIDDESGNTNERTINIDAVAEFRYRKSRHIVTLDNDLESQSGTDTKDERKVTYQFDRFLTQRWFLAGYGSWEQNKFKELKYKWVFASGPGYQFFDTDLLRLSIQGGLAYIDEKFVNSGERSYPALREATNFSWLLHENGLKFIHTNLIYQSLDTTENWVIESDTGITMPLLGALKAEFLFEYDYDNDPAGDAVKEDRIWKMGFSYEW